MTLRVVAIDWSGAQTGAEKKIWLAEVVGGRLEVLSCGRNRDAIAEHLIEESIRDAEMIVGFDFAFSMPQWFLRERDVASVRSLWERVARDGEAWLGRCEPPFWGRPGRRRPHAIEMFRRTELETRQVSGV